MMQQSRPVSEKCASVLRRFSCMAAALILLFSLPALLPGASACTGVYAGSAVTEDGSVWFGRSEDYGPDYVKHFVIIPAADHAEGEMFEDDYGFRIPCPAHTLRYSAVMDDVSNHGGIAKVPYAEAGINEKGVSVTATISIYFNDAVIAADPLTDGGITEMSMASFLLQSAETALDGVKLLTDCIDTWGHGRPEGTGPDYNETSAVLIADPNETWLVEIVSGHQYVAVRLSDDTVVVDPNALLTQQINTADGNLIVSPGLISVAEDGGFLVNDTGEENGIHVARTYSSGYFGSLSYRSYFGAYILNREIAEAMDPVPRPAAELADLYPNASAEVIAAGPFCLEYKPSPDVAGTIGLMTLRRVLSSHGEGSAYETGRPNESRYNEAIRSIGTYKQNEEHLFEIRRDETLPASVATVEWLAFGPTEFSVFIPFYAAAMTRTPDVCTTSSPESFDPSSLYWVFNEIGDTGNGRYYRLDANGIYRDRYGEEVDPEIAAAVLQFLNDSCVADRLHDHMTRMQEEIIARFSEDDAQTAALAGSASEEEISALADQLAETYCEEIMLFASEELAQIDREVAEFCSSAP